MGKCLTIILAPILLTVEEIITCHRRLKAESKFAKVVKNLGKKKQFSDLDDDGKKEIKEYYRAKELTMLNKRHLMARESSIQALGSKIQLRPLL